MLPSIVAAIAVSQSAVGAPVPDVVLTDMDRKPVRLSHFRGKKVVLFTWASW